VLGQIVSRLSMPPRPPMARVGIGISKPAVISTAQGALGHAHKISGGQFSCHSLRRVSARETNPQARTVG
jgi:hypothetical protein